MNRTSKGVAHGRVNLIGEHTDYNGGYVLPTAIQQTTEISLELTPGATVELMSSGKRAASYILGQEEPRDDWSDYLQGATFFLRERGIKLAGFRAEIQSNIPEGSGLSSSAALEMSFLKALKDLFSIELDDIEMARLAQRIENDFVGARVGIMDQMATGIALVGEALFLDTLTMDYERIQLPLEEMDLMVINSGISHKLSATDGGYNERRRQCEEVCRILGIELLREASLEDLKTHQLPEILVKRARHVITENERVLKAVKAIKENDLVTLGELFLASHDSMKLDYEVSIPEIDLLVNLCVDEPEVYGARLTGGGFGGSIVALTKKGKKSEIAHRVTASFKNLTGGTATLLA